MALRLHWLAILGWLATAPALAAPPPENESQGEQTSRGLLGIFIDDENEGAARIEQVKEGTPAAKAGLKPGDVVVAFNGQKIASGAALGKKLAGIRSGEEVRLEIEREGWRKEFRLVAMARPEEAKKPFLGLALEARPQGGLEVTEVLAGGPAAGAGIKPGDVVEKVEGRDMARLEDLAGIMAKKKPGDALALLIERDGWKKELKVTLGAKPAAEGAEAPAAERPKEKERPKEQPRAEQPKEKEKEKEKKPGFLGIYCKDTEGGLLVESTIEDSPAEKAGLKAGDLIVSVGGHPVRDLAGFTDLLAEKRAGDRLTIGLRRDGASKTVEAVLGERPGAIGEKPKRSEETAKPNPAAAKKPAYLGISLEVGPQGGLRIVKVWPGSPADKAGLREGQVVRMLDGEAVASLDDFAARLKAFKPGDSVKLIVVEDGKEKPVAVTLGAREN